MAPGMMANLAAVYTRHVDSTEYNEITDPTENEIPEKTITINRTYFEKNSSQGDGDGDEKRFSSFFDDSQVQNGDKDIVKGILDELSQLFGKIENASNGNKEKGQISDGTGLDPRDQRLGESETFESYIKRRWGR